MSSKSALPIVDSHVVDILASTKGRDQPIMLIDKAILLASCFSDKTYADKQTVFLDPFCKAGEILLATAMKSCWLRKTKSGAKPLATSTEVFKELYDSNRFFAIAPDLRHYLLSVRTFYGNENSHDKTIAKNISNGDYLSETDGKFDGDKFTRGLKSMIDYIKKAKPNCKIIAVGNPPYQEADGGAQASAKPIYNEFIEALIESKQISQFALVIPARWFSAGKGLDNFRREMMTCKQIKTIKYFQHSEEVFPTVQIKGGICFLHWTEDTNDETNFVTENNEQKIDLSRYDIIPDDPKAPSIIEKVKRRATQFVSEIAWAGKPFGFRTFHFQRTDGVPEGTKNSIPCYTTGRKIKHVLRSTVEKNVNKIDEWKVAIPRAYGKGMARCTLPKEQFFIIGKGEISTETYNIVGCFKTKAEAERFQEYLQTDFSRYLLGLRKLTQDIPKDRWDWVPLMDTSKSWTEKELFDHFKLTKEEREHIKAKVKEWS